MKPRLVIDVFSSLREIELLELNLSFRQALLVRHGRFNRNVHTPGTPVTSDARRTR